MTEKLVATNNRTVDVSNAEYDAFEKELASLINRHSMENGSDTPDFMIAEYLVKQLKIFNETTNTRRKWYGEPSLLDRIVGDGPLPPVPAETIIDKVNDMPDASLARDMYVQSYRRKNRHEAQVESYLAEYGSAKPDDSNSSDTSDGGSE